MYVLVKVMMVSGLKLIRVIDRLFVLLVMVCLEKVCMMRKVEM